MERSRERSLPAVDVVDDDSNDTTEEELDEVEYVGAEANEDRAPK